MKKHLVKSKIDMVKPIVLVYQELEIAELTYMFICVTIAICIAAFKVRSMCANTKT